LPAQSFPQTIIPFSWRVGKDVTLLFSLIAARRSVRAIANQRWWGELERPGRYSLALRPDLPRTNAIATQPPQNAHLIPALLVIQYTWAIRAAWPLPAAPRELMLPDAVCFQPSIRFRTWTNLPPVATDNYE